MNPSAGLRAERKSPQMGTPSAAHSRRRDKPILSCIFCRARKIRCDRQSPCGACSRRGKPAECIYTCTEQERREAVDYRPHTRTHQARQRIARLEDLVTEMRDMMESSRQPSADIATPSEPRNSPASSLAPAHGQVVDDMGKLRLTDNHAVYTGSSHWTTILEDIQHLKDELSEDSPGSTADLESGPFDPGLMQGSPTTRISLLNSAPPLPVDQILAMMPPRKVVDRHVSHFFNAFDMAPFILHRGRFLAEYASFWANPSAAPITWVGLLFSIMSMSAFLQQQDIGALGPSATASQEMLETYRTLTIQCLIAGDYVRPSRYTIETLTLHFGVDHNLNLDASISNWIMIGVIIRIALRMGIHRDPSHWPNIPPMQAELRRRLWIILYQMDLFTSAQVGLPRIIKDSQCDARLPAHIFDPEGNFEDDRLPPERPPTDPTPLNYLIQRHTIIKVTAEIYDATEAGPPSASDIAALSSKLERAINAIPASLKYTSLETSVADNPGTVLNQMFLDILIQKAVYLLHRRSFVKGSPGEDNTSSKELCIGAALAILEHQRRMHEETQPGGLMSGIRWKVYSSLNHEFLQATMMLCFALTRFSDGHLGTTNPGALQRRHDIKEALILAKNIWEKNSDRSVEAQRAAKAISTVLQQDLDRSVTQILPASDGVFDPMPGLAAQDYLGGFDYGQSMALDPSFFALGNDDAAFGGMLDDLMAEQSYRW